MDPTLALAPLDAVPPAIDPPGLETPGPAGDRRPSLISAARCCARSLARLGGQARRAGEDPDAVHDLRVASPPTRGHTFALARRGSARLARDAGAPAARRLRRRVGGRAMTQVELHAARALPCRAGATARRRRIARWIVGAVPLASARSRRAVRLADAARVSELRDRGGRDRHHAPLAASAGARFAAVSAGSLRASRPCAGGALGADALRGPAASRRCASRSRSAAMRSRAGSRSRPHWHRSRPARLRAAQRSARPDARRRACFCARLARSRAALARARASRRGAVGRALDRDVDARPGRRLAGFPAPSGPRFSRTSARRHARASRSRRGPAIQPSRPIRRRAAHSSSWASRRAAARIATRPPRRRDAHRAHQLVVAAVEALGDAQQRREPAHRTPLRRAARSRSSASRFRGSRLAVIARDHRDQLDLLGRQPAQVAVTDDVVRMLGVPVVADRGADVVQQRGVLRAARAPRAAAGARPEGRRTARATVSRRDAACAPSAETWRAAASTLRSRRSSTCSSAVISRA